MRISMMLPTGRLSYVNLAQPRENKNGVKRYKTAIVFEPGTDLSELKRNILAIAKDVWGDDAANLIRTGRLHWPLRGEGEPGNDTDADLIEKGYTPGSVFMNTSSKSRPGVVDAMAVSVDDVEAEAYPGRDANLHVTLQDFDVDGNRGVAVYVNAVQLLGHNDRFDGRVAATQLFSPVEGIEDTELETAGATGVSDDELEGLVG